MRKRGVTVVHSLVLMFITSTQFLHLPLPQSEPVQSKHKVHWLRGVGMGGKISDALLSLTFSCETEEGVSGCLYMITTTHTSKKTINKNKANIPYMDYLAIETILLLLGRYGTNT